MQKPEHPRTNAFRPGMPSAPVLFAQHNLHFQQPAQTKTRLDPVPEHAFANQRDSPIALVKFPKSKAATSSTIIATTLRTTFTLKRSGSPVNKQTSLERVTEMLLAVKTENHFVGRSSLSQKCATAKTTIAMEKPMKVCVMMEMFAPLISATQTVPANSQKYL